RFVKQRCGLSGLADLGFRQNIIQFIEHLESSVSNVDHGDCDAADRFTAAPEILGGSGTLYSKTESGVHNGSQDTSGTCLLFLPSHRLGSLCPTAHLEAGPYMDYLLVCAPGRRCVTRESRRGALQFDLDDGEGIGGCGAPRAAGYAA